MKILVATQNPGKAREFRTLLAPLQADICFPTDLGLEIEVREDGNTYADNARKKAQVYMNASDDSGLEVDALHGAPGIRSARYALGHDTDRVTALLAQLRGVPWEQRTARFRCVIIIATPSGEFYKTEGICEGQIAFESEGERGFGYDPVFHLPDSDCTMAQLPPAEKNLISHRAQAIEAAIPILRSLL